MTGLEPESIVEHLRAISSLCNACWVVLLNHENNTWNMQASCGLNNNKQNALYAFLEKPDINTWLAGGFTSGRLRWHSVGTIAKQLGCSRIFFFPIKQNQGGILLGINALENPAKNAISIITKYFWPTYQQSKLSQDEVKIDNVNRPENVDLSYNPHHSLDRIIHDLAELIGCEMAYIAILSGNSFNVKAEWNCEGKFINRELTINDIQPLKSIVSSHRGMILRGKTLDQVKSNLCLESKPINAWMGVPILFGKQVIGLTAFVTTRRGWFTSEKLSQAYIQANRSAYSVENTIILSEAGHYMEQMALLNELVSIVAQGIEINEVARRIMQRLRRVFNIDWAAVFLISSDESFLREYGGEGRRHEPLILPVKTTLVGLAVQSGMPIRDNNVTAEKYFRPIGSNSRSEMAVPLKYQGKVIGAIDLLSTEANAFKSQDEQLLVLLSSHLAGLLENMRLRNETQERAKKLQETVSQLQALWETALDISSSLDFNTLLTRIVRRAQLLVDARGAELGLFDEKEQVVTIVVSETPYEKTNQTKIPINGGIHGKMISSGKPIVVSDYNNWSGITPSEQEPSFHVAAGVPLKIHGKSIGTLVVMEDRHGKFFGESDIHLLELLAPQAVISIGNARLYQELQDRIEAQQRAESHLIRSARLAAVGEMAASFAHELNNPLTTVTGFIELVMNNLDPSSPHHADLDLVLQEALRARNVVRSMLDFSRPAEVIHIKTDFNELVQKMLVLTRHFMNSSGVSLHLKLQEKLPWVSVDINQIQQVLHNLIFNAIQAMPTGGILSIQTCTVERNGSKWVTARVKDTGVGIPEENLDRIFEPFFTTRSSSKGTGLGLSISYSIIESHGGFIEVSSQVGQGSCFTIYLPIQPDH